MIRKIPSYKTAPGTLPFSTYEWVKIWHETIGKVWELNILQINNIVAPLATKGNEIILAGGYEVADYLDLIGPDKEKAQAWNEIRKEYHGMKLLLRNIPENSATVKYFLMKKEDTTPMMMLPPVLDKKSRHEMERKLRKFERENPHIEFQDTHDIEILLSLMKLDPRKKEFLSPDMEQFFRNIHVFGTITQLLVNKIPAAALLAFRTGDTLMSYNSGFDDEHFSGAGFYLKTMHIRRAIDNGIKTYNFLQGSERYKYELGGKDFFVYRVDAML